MKSLFEETKNMPTTPQNLRSKRPHQATSKAAAPCHLLARMQEVYAVLRINTKKKKHNCTPLGVDNVAQYSLHKSAKGNNAGNFTFLCTTTALPL